MRRRVAILLFDDVEVLDFAGPFEVFSVAGQRDGTRPGHFEVMTVSRDGREVAARNGLRIVPDYAMADCPAPAILVLPGGFGTRPLLKDETVLAWIDTTRRAAEVTLSVCTGALLLAKLGALSNADAVTHQGALGELARIEPSARIVERRFVDNGPIVVSAGVAAGIDASFHLVARLVGEAEAVETARYIEYDWQPGIPSE